MDTLENLRRKIESAGEVKSVVRTMKAMAASNIGQYELAAAALNDYYHTVVLGLMAYFKRDNVYATNKHGQSKKLPIAGIVFGSDQGLIGQFNDVITHFAIRSLAAMPGEKEIWAVGGQVLQQFSDSGFTVKKVFTVPNSVSAVTSLVEQVLVDIEREREAGRISEFHVFHNHPKNKATYQPIVQRLMPLDNEWESTFKKQKWPTNKIPQIIGERASAFLALISEYLFVSLYRASAESLACENASRLDAMQRAQKNVDDLLDELSNKYHRLRQTSIDEELFDVVLGSEALKKKQA